VELNAEASGVGLGHEKPFQNGADGLSIRRRHLPDRLWRERGTLNAMQIAI